MAGPTSKLEGLVFGGAGASEISKAEPSVRVSHKLDFCTALRTFGSRVPVACPSLRQSAVMPSRTFSPRLPWILLCVTGSLPFLSASARAQGAFDEVGIRAGWMRTGLSVTYSGCGSESAPPGSCVVAADAHARRSSAAGAAFARRRVWKPLSLQLEIQYATKGYAVTQPTLHVDYLELPVLARVDLSTAHVPVSIHSVAGFAPGVRVRCRVYAQTVGQPCSSGSVLDNDPARFETDRVLGAGVRVGSPERAVTLDLLHASSLTNMDLWNGSKASFSSTQIAVGLSWHLRQNPLK